VSPRLNENDRNKVAQGLTRRSYRCERDTKVRGSGEAGNAEGFEKGIGSAGGRRAETFSNCMPAGNSAATDTVVEAPLAFGDDSSTATSEVNV